MYAHRPSVCVNGADMRDIISTILLFCVGVLAAAMVAILLPQHGWTRFATGVIWTVIFFPIAASRFPSDRHYWYFAVTTVGAATALSAFGPNLSDTQSLVVTLTVLTVALLGLGYRSVTRRHRQRE